MKNSAIFRIVAWGLAVVCLSAILLSGLGLRSYRSHTVFDRTKEVSVTQVTHPLEDLGETATLAAAATVYSSPSAESGDHNGELDAGTEITIARRELVNNQQWAYTTSPIQGWILTENLESAVVEVTGPADPVVYTAPNIPVAYGSSMKAENVSSISINWVSGQIHIIPTAGDRITIEETESDHPMVLKNKEGKLTIDFCEGSLSLLKPKKKDLVISVPADWVCRDLEIDADSSDIVVQALTAQTVEMDTASGTSEFIDCAVGSLEIDTASGDIGFTGSLDTLECDAASASFTATLNNSPRNLEMNSASGNLVLTIPEETGFTVRMEGLKSIFSADDFQIKAENGAYVHGDGACRIEMESVSGGVHLFKG